MARSLGWFLLSASLLLGCRGGAHEPAPAPSPDDPTRASEATRAGHVTDASTGGDAAEEETRETGETSDGSSTGGIAASEGGAAEGAAEGPPTLSTTCTSDEECARTSAWNYRGQCCSKCSRAANKASIEARAAYCRDAGRPSSCPRVRCAYQPGEPRCVSGKCAIVDAAGMPEGATKKPVAP